MTGLLVVAALVLVLPAAASASRLGVGIDRGQLAVDHSLRPGSRVSLAMGVFNTGDQAAKYVMSAASQNGQTQISVPDGWFSFSPHELFLTPGAGYQVAVTLTVPVHAAPGDYFALVQASPVVEGGNVNVGIAAASKLTFTVAPASLWQAIFFRVGDWLAAMWPWSLVVPIAIVLALAVLLLGRRYRFRLELSRRGSSSRAAQDSGEPVGDE
jgi:hypothetical protein